MCDSHQTFGVAVPLLSVKSDVVRERVLKVTKTMHTKHLAATSLLEKDDVPRLDPGEEASQGATLRVLRLVEDVVGDLTHYWETEVIDQSGKRTLETLLPQLDSGSLLVQSAYWLALRLGKLF